jgi:hypothetical protein
MKKDNKIKEPTVSNQKKQYEKPCLKSLGDIRDVTMGGSPGSGDSGSSLPELPF